MYKYIFLGGHPLLAKVKCSHRPIIWNRQGLPKIPNNREFKIIDLP